MDILAGWIRDSDWDQVQSTYGDHLRFVQVEKRQYDDRLERITCLQNTVTRDFYMPDSVQTVAIKSFMIAVGAPIYTAGRIAFHVCRMVYLIGVIFAKAISLFKRDLQEEKSGVESFFQRLVVDLACEIFTKAILEQLWECIKAPYYGLGLFIAACEGFLHDPYKAKAEIALIERYWNRDKTRHHDWRIQGRIHQTCWGGMLHADAFFLAFCMQPIGNENDTITGRSENRFRVLRELVANNQPCSPCPLIPVPCQAC